jgi:2-amino-4-hydroxy-6-hydroxymethyldihydropteridine diphosphokinase
MLLIALGANLPSRQGGPRETLEAALDELSAHGLAVAAASRWYRTPAFPAGTGPDFVNGAARLEGRLDPAAAMAALHAVERRFGRTRARRWEPRVCDLDLLAADDCVLPDAAVVRAWMAMAAEDQARSTPPGLILPHPRMHERGFVLAPLADVAPDWVHPLLGQSVRQMLAALPASARSGMAPIPSE